MTITFDPKARTIANNPTDPAKAEGTVASQDPLYPREVITEMDLLFSGLQRQGQLRASHPADLPEIPDFERDIMKPMSILGSSSITTKGIIDRYQMVRQNLIERRSNLSIALEGSLKPDEAFDVIGRIEDIDEALKTLQRNLDKAHKADRAIRDLELQAKLRSSGTE